MTGNTPPDIQKLEGLWADGKLEPCPSCGRRRLVPRGGGRAMPICLDCGILKDDKPVVSERKPDAP